MMYKVCAFGCVVSVLSSRLRCPQGRAVVIQIMLQLPVVLAGRNARLDVNLGLTGSIVYSVLGRWVWTLVDR